MLILKVNIEGNIHTYSFNQEHVIIGKGNETCVDISLPDENIQDQHINITKQQDKYVAVNMTNDPFATINELPFGKKILKENDCLKLGKTNIIVGQISSGPVVLKEEIVPVDISNEESELYFNAIEEHPISDILQKDKPIEDPPVPSPIEMAIAAPEKPRVAAVIPKEEIAEIRREPMAAPINNLEKNGFKTSKRKVFLFLLSTTFIAILFAAIICYEIINDRSDESRHIAAEGVADVAMALAYAQVHHIKPQKQNWMDPEFLTENLFSILSSEYPSFANIDNQGQFRNCPYLLRVYISNDLSHFLVIAQPNPSITQWIAPKPTILVDSHSMEIRTLQDLKTINRLLASSRTLDHTNGPEIVDSIKQGTLIPLTSLGAKKGFSPPKALALFKPGAENRIYNAPRYYQFGESLLRDALNISSVGGESHEKTRLHNQIESLSRYKDLVLYSSKGLHYAIQAQKALNEIYPNNPFFISYLIFNNKGMVSSSHLLFNNSEMTAKEMIAENDQGKTLLGEKQQGVVHPLIIELNALKIKRTERLEQLNGEIKILLRNNNQSVLKNFDQKIDTLILQYKQENDRLNEEINKKIAEIQNAKIDVHQLALLDELKETEEASYKKDVFYHQLKKRATKESLFFDTLYNLLEP